MFSRLTGECSGNKRGWLTRDSEYFRAMPSALASPADEGSKAVHMDCASSDLALILKLIDKAHCGYPNWDQLARIITPGERYQFKHMPDLVRLPASHCLSYNASAAVSIFQFAGSNGFRDLARLAIASFWKITHLINREYDEIPDYVCDGIPGRYGAALIVAVADHPRVKGLVPQARWERISASFIVR
jgi:hypothetical protein